MPAASPQTIKLKSQLRLLIPRLRNAQKKDTALSITSRREMAELLSQNREASARIRVENIIATDICVELMEILELYAELLLARAGLLDVRDRNVKEGLVGKGDVEGGGESATGLEEAAASIIYSAPRLPREVKELAVVRTLLVERFGKEFAIKVQGDGDGETTGPGGGLVPKKVWEKLRVEPPREELVQGYLEEIARTYGVDWPRHREAIQDLQGEVEREGVDGEDDNDDDDGVGGGAKEPPILADGAASAADEPQKGPPSLISTPKPKKVDLSNLRDATPPSNLHSGAKSPVSVAPPGARTDNLSPKVRLPGGGEMGKGKSAGTGGISRGKNDGGRPGGQVPTVDDLDARFKALKRM